MSALDTPDFKFSGFYFPEIMRDLLAFRRINTPELSDEDPNEVSIQLLRTFALGQHYENVLLDFVALEAILSTSRLRSSVAGHLGLIGVRLLRDVPATADLVVTLTRPLAADVTLPALARYAAEATDQNSEVPFEVVDAVALTASEALEAIWELDGSAWTDRTAALAPGGAGGVSPFAGTAAAGDALYFGHSTVLWNEMTIVKSAADALTLPNGYVVEYYDGQIDQEYPTAVTDLGSLVARLNLNSLLGSNNRTGSQITVRAVSTGAKVVLTSAYTGSTNYVDVTVSQIGLVAVSTTPADYRIGAKWREVAGYAEAVDGTETTATYTLPETATRKWTTSDLTVVLGDATAPAGEYYWLRMRCLASGSSGTYESIDPSTGKQFYKVVAVQGRTYSETLGVSTGGSDQAFISLRPDIIEGTPRLFVDEGSGPQEWTVADTLINANASSRAAMLTYDDEGSAIFRLGDGSKGKIPTVSSPISATYRTGATVNGNVGAGTITANRAGTTMAAAVTNPRAASGWVQAEGSTAADIERLKIEGPASLRDLEKALTSADAANLARKWKSADGAKPFVRASVIEGAFGPKTIEVVVVEPGEAAATDEDVEAFQTYLNGDAIEGIDGALLMNTRATVTRYTRKTVNLVVATKGGNEARIKAALQAVLTPNYLESDGTYLYDFSGKVYRERLVAAIFSSGGIKNVSTLTLNGSSSDITLGARELPVCGTVTVTVTA